MALQDFPWESSCCGSINPVAVAQLAWQAGSSRQLAPRQQLLSL
eukprot:SAG25_NODE_1249_length_3494_cov_27.356805_2_plen_44_part_00